MTTARQWLPENSEKAFPGTRREVRGLPLKAEEEEEQFKSPATHEYVEKTL